MDQKKHPVRQLAPVKHALVRDRHAPAKQTPLVIGSETMRPDATKTAEAVHSNALTKTIAPDPAEDLVAPNAKATVVATSQQAKARA